MEFFSLQKNNFFTQKLRVKCVFKRTSNERIHQTRTRLDLQSIKNFASDSQQYLLRCTGDTPYSVYLNNKKKRLTFQHIHSIESYSVPSLTSNISVSFLLPYINTYCSLFQSMNDRGHRFTYTKSLLSACLLHSEFSIDF